jgi:hypothetical protein
MIFLKLIIVLVAASRRSAMFTTMWRVTLRPHSGYRCSTLTPLKRPSPSKIMWTKQASPPIDILNSLLAVTSDPTDRVVAARELIAGFTSDPTAREDHSQAAKTGKCNQRPWNSGLRFSMKARRPSLKSSLSAH